MRPEAFDGLDIENGPSPPKQCKHIKKEGKIPLALFSHFVVGRSYFATSCQPAAVVYLIQGPFRIFTFT
jgi:hypothetical protein